MLRFSLLFCLLFCSLKHVHGQYLGYSLQAQFNMRDPLIVNMGLGFWYEQPFTSDKFIWRAGLSLSIRGMNFVETYLPSAYEPHDERYLVYTKKYTPQEAFFDMKYYLAGDYEGGFFVMGGGGLGIAMAVNEVGGQELDDYIFDFEVNVKRRFGFFNPRAGLGYDFGNMFIEARAFRPVAFSTNENCKMYFGFSGHFGLRL